MSDHMTHAMHANSLEAHAELDRASRYQSILEAFSACGAMTDREVMVSLHFGDPNTVRPRITELVKKGLLEECGKRVDPKSRKHVRVCRLVPRQLEMAV